MCCTRRQQRERTSRVATPRDHRDFRYWSVLIVSPSGRAADCGGRSLLTVTVAQPSAAFSATEVNRAPRHKSGGRCVHFDRPRKDFQRLVHCLGGDAPSILCTCAVNVAQLCLAAVVPQK